MGALLSVCTLVISLLVPWVIIIVFAIIAGMKANGGELYRYPMTYRFIK